ncbi:hypothetical protein GCM10023084_72480 [Streptomyces lacrimifluminis]|uniref:Uncharacterized protein n=1 Tax=Streptomyces lacrimifluminis TaxID=1500077 RepID=A0A917UKL5_9ACTN|nr:hypothetical protein GCM10012282_70560 [Streptomyces lacrimifluminis]
MHRTRSRSGTKVATNRRLSFTDLAIYIKCLSLFDACGPEADGEWLIRELSLPPEETRHSMRRLVELGYLRTPQSICEDMAEPLHLRR